MSVDASTAVRSHGLLCWSSRCCIAPPLAVEKMQSLVDATRAMRQELTS